MSHILDSKKSKYGNLGPSLVTNQSINIPNSNKSGVRKYEGYDMGKSNLSQVSKNFDKTIHQLNTQTTDANIEEEYIKGLQDEIKYQEYELKLLKDKEIEQQQSLSQLDQFFNDGVPLNDNILAMKNQFNVTKNDKENHLKKLKEETIKYKRQNDELLEETKKMSQIYELMNKTIKDREDKYLKKLEQERLNFNNERHKNEENEQLIKQKKELLKRYKEDILKINRQNERESYITEFKEEKRFETLDNLKKNNIERDKQILELQKEMDELRNFNEISPLEEKLEDERNEVRKKILFNEKAINMAQNKIKEYEYQADIRKKEREVEAAQKRDLQNELEALKKQLDQESKLSEKVLAFKVKQAEKLQIRKIERDIENVRNQVELYQNRIDFLKHEFELMNDLSFKIKQDWMDQEQKKEIDAKTLKEAKDLIYKFISQNNTYKLRCDEVNKIVQPLQEEIKQIEKELPDLEQRNDDLAKFIDQKNRQLDLSYQIKAFNLEQIALVSSTNNQVFDQINKLMHNYENIYFRQPKTQNFIFDQCIDPNKPVNNN